MEDGSLFDFSNEENEVKEVKTWSKVKSGINSFTMHEVTLDDKFNLDFRFKGSKKVELGNYGHRVWANNFDTKAVNVQGNPSYNKIGASIAKGQVVSICQAYLSTEEVNSLVGKGVKYAGDTQAKQWVSFVKAVVKLFTPDKYMDKEVELKLVLAWGDKEDKDGDIKVELSTQRGAIISSDLKPLALKLNDAINPNNGDPYERFEPLYTYAEDNGTDEAPTSGPVEAVFGKTEELAPGFAAEAKPEDIPPF